MRNLPAPQSSLGEQGAAQALGAEESPASQHAQSSAYCVVHGCLTQLHFCHVHLFGLLEAWDSDRFISVLFGTDPVRWQWIGTRRWSL